MPAVMLFFFAFTLFCSATLLFLIEPMVGKMMLPLLGGTPAVWNTCMVFFQGVLLAGYGFAHATTSWLGARRQATLQLAFLFLPLASFIVNALFFTGLLSPNEQLILGREANPIPALLLVLTLSVGLPMFVVCTSAPLLTRWFSSTDHPAARDPYFLYGASNLGSMLMLIGYPLLVEPYLSLRGQQVVWVIGYGLLSVCVAGCAVLMWRSRPAPEATTVAPEPEAPPPGFSARRTTPNAVTGAQGGPRRPPQPRSPTGGGLPGTLLVACGCVLVPLGAFLLIGQFTGSYSPVPYAGFLVIALGGVLLGCGDRRVANAEGGGEEAPAPEAAHRPVTWLRRLRWVLLALVPSSLMLGVTTYVTTDIAAIPLLWVAPLTLYLMTFIVVFARIPSRHQAVYMTLATLGLLGTLVLWVAPAYVQNDSVLWLLRVGGLGVGVFSFQILKVRDDRLIHRVMVMVMPLVVLLLLFIMLSKTKPGIWVSISLHLFTLLIVSMVCHGELALDRPRPKHLTEFFLWMSFGGVVGGLFNALIAPVTFNSLVEYPLMMMAACLLLPPLGIVRDNVWARRADLALAGVFVVVAVTLLFLRARHPLPDFAPLKASPWGQGLFAIACGIGLGGLAAWKGWGQAGGSLAFEGEPEPAEPDHPVDRALDLILPGALLLLTVGLYWGLPTSGVEDRLAVLAGWFRISPTQFRVILTYGLPAVLCYTFVERATRFGLGVGAILLGIGFSTILADPPLFQERSFFGVLRVEAFNDTVDGFPYSYYQLVHGTTLHGQQFTDADLRDTPLSYYHRTGPVGNVFRLYNTDPREAVAVIGLGTGTMASYGLPGQRLDFYDIDPVVVGISFDTNRFFTFVEDAEGRGVDVNLVLGDARLTLRPKGVKTTLKPMHRRDATYDAGGAQTAAAVRPPRQFGRPIGEDFKYRLIVVDAFSSDAIPIHLITQQAVQIYFDRLAPGGIVCMHISNRHLNLQPVLANIADALGVVGYHMSDDDQGAAGKSRSHWVALARTEADLQRLLRRPRWETDAEQQALLGVALWPSPGPTLSTTAGLAHAFQAIAEEQDRMLARDEGLPGDPGEVRGRWIPLDQPTRLGGHESENEKLAEEVRQRLERIAEPLAAAKGRSDEARKLAEEARKRLKGSRDELQQLRVSFGALTDRQEAALTPVQRAQLAKRRKEVEERAEAWRRAQTAAGQADLPRAWLEQVEKRLKDEQTRVAELAASYPMKIALARRVGVWTDDYSNLIAVVNW